MKEGNEMKAGRKEETAQSECRAEQSWDVNQLKSRNVVRMTRVGVLLGD